MDTSGECFLYCTLEEQVLFLTGTRLIYIEYPLGRRRAMLPLETLSTDLAIVKTTQPELWSYSSPEDMKSFRFPKGNKNSIAPKPSFHTSSLKITSSFTACFKSHLSAFGIRFRTCFCWCCYCYGYYFVFNYFGISMQ